MNRIFTKVLARKEIIDNPPVLVDIGASEKIHSKWNKIAKHSICVAFDADQRDFEFVEKEQNKFRKLYIFNCIVSNKDEKKTKFYLTKSPYCSSTLKPNHSGLKHYLFSPLFEIQNEVKLNNISLTEAFHQLNIKKIDWLKSDSQGIDLRLFKSLNDNLQKNILVVEFEPGIIDAYEDEDKMHSILSYMETKNFWLSDFVLKGVARIPYKLFQSHFEENLFGKLMRESLKKVPGWGEMTFFNSFHDEEIFSIREYLLGWFFATIEQHHSFALYLGERGKAIFNDDIFNELVLYSIKQMKYRVLKLKFLPSILDNFRKKLR